MKTDDLIGMLATGAGAADPPGDARRMALGAALVLPVMIAAVWAALGLLPPVYWPISGTIPKAGYALLLLTGGVLLLRRLGRPGSAIALPVGIIAATLAAVASIGLWDLLNQPAREWSTHIFGHSSPICPFAILTLSIPALFVMLRAARLLAPTRLRLAGAAAGLAAGALAAGAYTLGCTEGSLTFVAIWYTLGMTLATGLGALIGPRALRW